MAGGWSSSLRVVMQMEVKVRPWLAMRAKLKENYSIVILAELAILYTTIINFTINFT